MRTNERINGINNWIKENPEVKEPNFYEITSCLIEVGNKPDKESLEGMKEMLELRDVFNHPFMKEDGPKDLFKEIVNNSFIENKQVSLEKSELLCKLMAVSFYIFQTKKNEPNYIYDNVGEFEKMKSMQMVCQDDISFMENIDKVFNYIEKSYVNKNNISNHHTK